MSSQVRRSIQSRIFVALAELAACALVPSLASARTREFCAVLGVGVTQPCGGHGEVACTSGAQCDAGHAPYSGSPLPETVNCPAPIADETISAVCYECGANGELGCTGATKCNAGLVHATTSGLDGPITACPFLPPNPPANAYFSVTSAQLVNAAGICSIGTPAVLTGASREPWPVPDPADTGRGTVIVVHGRGSSCGGSMANLLDSAGIRERNHVNYCVEYSQAATDPVRRRIQVLAVDQDETGAGGTPCEVAGNCSWNHANPVHEVFAASYDLNALADALAQAIEAVPTVGEITLVPHSQGGFITRALLHRHYDALRWKGKRISRVLSLAHPYYGKVVDPAKVTPWLCADTNDFDCVFHRWLWGWDNWLASGNGHIDDTDLPGIEWTAVSGAGIPGGTGAESVSDACLEIFGGTWRPDVVGDTSVPIQSSLGIDEHGYFNASPLVFDDARSESCTHTASCLLGEVLAADAARIPSAAAVVLPNGSLDFDGANDALNVSAPAGSPLALTGDFTLEAWVRPEGRGDGMIVNKEGEYQLGVWAGTGEIFWAIANANPGWASVSTGYRVPLFQWTHIAVVHRLDQDVRTYVNGALVHTRAASGPIGDVNAIDDLRIGNRGTGGTPFDGRIDELRISNVALDPDELSFRTARGAGSPGGSGLVGQWSFDEPSGNVAVDASGLGSDGLLDGLGAGLAPIRRSDDRERLGGALYFDGTDDFVGVSSPGSLAALTMSNALTLEAWVFPRGNGNATFGSVIVNKEGEYQLYRNASGNVVFTLAGTPFGWSSRTTSVQLPLREWSHVALRYDATLTHVEVYKDGALAESVACHPASPATPCGGPIGDFHTNWNELRIGGRQNGGNPHYFHGVIDEVRVWSVARTPAEIAAAYATPIPHGATGLAGYWRFDESDSGVAFDASLGAHAAALGGGALAAEPTPASAPQLPGYPAALALDRDGDGVAAAADNCPSAYNPGQEDRGGIGASAAPDGIGDACQCGDVTGDGRVTTADAIVVTRSLLVPPTATLAAPERCNVGGSPGCSTADAAILTRALLAPPTASVAQVCAPALP